MKERKAIHERYIAQLIAESQTNNFQTLMDAQDINCYAAARLLTRSDKHKLYYAPGRIYNLKYGTGKFLKNELDPYFIDECIQRDSRALNQPCTRVNFKSIDKMDGYHYFGLCKYHLCPSKISDPILSPYLKNVDDSKMREQWHFIFRIPAGNWLHKPGFEDPIDIIDWDIYGKSFSGKTWNDTFGIYIPLKVICFEEFFYRIDQKFDLFLESDLID